MLLATSTVQELAAQLVNFLNEPQRPAKELESVFEANLRQDPRDRPALRSPEHYEILRDDVVTLLRTKPADYLTWWENPRSGELVPEYAPEVFLMRNLLAGTEDQRTPILGFLGLENPNPDSRKLTLVIQHPQFCSVDDLLSVLVTELLEESEQHQVAIDACRTCKRFMLRSGGRGRRRLDCAECASRRSHHKQKREITRRRRAAPHTKGGRR